MSAPDLSPTFWQYLHGHIFAIWRSSSAPAWSTPAASTSPARRGHWRRSQGPRDDATEQSFAPGHACVRASGGCPEKHLLLPAPDRRFPCRKGEEVTLQK